MRQNYPQTVSDKTTTWYYASVDAGKHKTESPSANPRDVDLNTGLFDSRTENVVQQTRTRVEKRQTLTDCLASLSNDDDGDDGFDDCFDDGK